MDLAEYLFRMKISIVDFSKQIDFSRTHVSEVMRGKRRPSKKLARIIERETSGKVSSKEILGG